jgi:sugar lactone lactonase YvrE
MRAALLGLLVPMTLGAVHRVAAEEPPLFLYYWTGCNFTAFGYPNDLAVSAAGQVYVLDKHNGRVSCFEGGTAVCSASWGGLTQPLGLAVAPDGFVFVADGSNGVRKFTSTGSPVLSWPVSASDIDVSEAGDVFTLVGHRVFRFTADGSLLDQWGEYGSEDGQLDHATCLAADATGTIYVANWTPGSWRIKRFTEDGTFLLSWGSSGTGDGEFQGIAKLSIDSAGNVYVAESTNGRIQKFTAEGLFLTNWSTWNHHSASSVAADGQRFVYVAAYGQVQKYAYPIVALEHESWGSVKARFFGE